MEIRHLRATDDRERFRSGDPDLDRFFHLYAGQNQFRRHVGTTYVAVDGTEILGYVTIAAGSLEIDELPAAARQGLPRYPLPVLRLARLAVEVTRQGRGLGKELLAFVLRLALTMAEDYGCVGVVVDSKPGAVSFYEGHGFRRLEMVEGQSDSRPQPAPMFLPTSEIRAATGRRASARSRQFHSECARAMGVPGTIRPRRTNRPPHERPRRRAGFPNAESPNPARLGCAEHRLPGDR